MVRLKEKEDSQAKRRHLSLAPVKTAEPREEERVLLEVWGQAVNRLRETTFENMDQAINAVVEAVLERTVKEDVDGAQVKEFLFDLLDTDPDLKEELRRVLAIK